MRDDLSDEAWERIISDLRELRGSGEPPMPKWGADTSDGTWKDRIHVLAVKRLSAARFARNTVMYERWHGKLAVHTNVPFRVFTGVRRRRGMVQRLAPGVSRFPSKTETWLCSLTWTEHYPVKVDGAGSNPVTTALGMNWRVDESCPEAARSLHRFDSGHLHGRLTARLASWTRRKRREHSQCRSATTGCSSAWTEHLVWGQGVARSNRVIPTS